MVIILANDNRFIKAQFLNHFGEGNVQDENFKSG